MDYENPPPSPADKPIGNCIRQNEDGTILVELDETHPMVQGLIVTALLKGMDAANAELKRHQSVQRN